jgi:hypothetical protein
MGLPSRPVTLTVEQVDELNRKLSNMRHDINNHLALIVASVELLRIRPNQPERVTGTLGEQPGKIADLLRKFSADFENTVGITKP